jgi:hypothetical protein
MRGFRLCSCPCTTSSKGHDLGGWHYGNSDRIVGLEAFDGDGTTELLTAKGNAFRCLDLRAYGSPIGDWFVTVEEGVVSIGNLTSAPGQVLLIQKEVNKARRIRTPVSLPMRVCSLQKDFIHSESMEQFHTLRLERGEPATTVCLCRG